ncbi:MAG: PAS domain-containing protein, partial [Cystobacter sp.]
MSGRASSSAGGAREQRFADLLDSRREEILRRWTERVACFHASGTHSRSELEDHMPQFLASLTHNLREGRQQRARDYGSPSPVKSQGVHPGLQRWRLGFDLDAVVREYGELREVFEELCDEQGFEPSLDEGRLLHQSLSTAVAEAVSSYTASQRLRLQEGWLTLDAVENGDAFFILDAEWRMIRVNRTQERLSQVPRGQSLGRSFWDVFPLTAEPSLQYWSQYHRVMRERVAVAFEEYYPPLDLWTEVTAYPEEAGGIIVFFRDVTEKKRLEAALRHSEERYELASRATQEAIWDWDLVADRVAWNEGVSSLFGYRLADVEESGEWWLAHIHPEDRERVEHHIHVFIETAGSERWSCEYRFRRADGSHAEIVDRGYLARDERGRALRMVGAMQDMTAQRAAEAESARARRFEQRRERQILGLAEAAAAIHGATSREGILRALSLYARALVESHRAAASLFKPTEGAPAITEVSFSDSSAAWKQGAEAEGAPASSRAGLCVPLVGREGRQLGFVQLEDKLDGGAFNTDDEAVVLQLARYTSGALENERLAAETQEAQQRARIAVEATQLGTWDLDSRSATLSWDARCRQLFGLSLEVPVDYALFLSLIH